MKPKLPGLRAKLTRFYLDNPDEELTIDDIVQKFGYSRQTVHNMVSALKCEGLIHTSLVVRAGIKAE